MKDWLMAFAAALSVAAIAVWCAYILFLFWGSL